MRDGQPVAFFEGNLGIRVRLNKQELEAYDGERLSKQAVAAIRQTPEKAKEHLNRLKKI